ncbi:hypothetical protein F5Y07DRAFT_413353 [Xylaria sp. FL0933]|nr:hypothetical protein F5Y07DRAFT_413353 [Xylaria sp. FL0933]
MPHTIDEADQAVAEQEIPVTIDPEIRVLCVFNAHVTEDVVFSIQIYHRRWYNFLADPDQLVPTHLPGKIGRLPAEIRFIIYDYLMPAKSYFIDYLGTSPPFWVPRVPRTLFAIPKIAHVCRDMRLYAMSKYQFVCYGYRTFKRGPLISDGPSDESIRETGRTWKWNVIPMSEGCKLGVFNPREDLLEIHLRSIRALQVAEDATVEWGDAFQEPILADAPLRTKWYLPKETDNLFVFAPHEPDMWQSFWAGSWVKRLPAWVEGEE